MAANPPGDWTKSRPDAYVSNYLTVRGTVLHIRTLNRRHTACRGFNLSTHLTMKGFARLNHIQPEVSTGQLELPTAQITSRTSSRISFLSPQNPHRNRQLCHDSKRLTCIAVRTLRGFLNKKLCFRLPNNIQHLTSNSRIFSQTLLLLFFNILPRTSVWARLDFVILDTNFPPLPASAPEWTVAAPRCVGGGTTPTANVQPSLWGQELTIMLSQAFLFHPPKKCAKPFGYL